MKNWMLITGLLILTMTTGQVLAQVGTEEALALTPNPENGKAHYAVCSACHLAQGWGTVDGTFPQLAGQSHQVAVKQLMDIRALNRDNPTMHPFTIPETIGGMQNLVDVCGYIEQLPMSPNHGRGPWTEGTAEYAHGQELYNNSCSECHMPDGVGVADKMYPLIQGQHYLYMVRQFEWIRDGKRRNANPEMFQLIQEFTDQDMAHVLNYVSHIPVPPEKLGSPDQAIQ